MRTRAGIAAIAAFVLLAGAAPAAALPASVQDFEFESLHADYDLGIDEAGHATMRVTETIVARFPDFDQNRGIIRAIPLEYRDVPLEVSMASVTDAEGMPVHFERDDTTEFAEFALGTDEFVHGRTTYVLEYTLKHVIGHFADADVDEFYWDVNGTGWSQPFDSVSARITLSPALQRGLTGAVACFQGYEGDTDECELVAAGTGFSAEVGPLQPYQNLTVVLAFAPGTVVQPPPASEHWIVRIVPWVLLGLAAAVTLAALVLRLTRWRDAGTRRALIAQYERPDGSWLMLDAEIVGRPGTGIPAQLMDFAVRGNLRIIDPPADTRRFLLEFVHGNGITDDERALIRAIFGFDPSRGNRVDLGRRDSVRGAALHRLRQGIRAKAIARGLRRRPGDTGARALRWAAFLALAAFIPVWVWAGDRDVLGAVVMWCTVGTAALWIVTLVVLRRPAPLTESGAELEHHLLGLREYLTIAEEDRIRMLQGPDTAERFGGPDGDAIVKLYESLLPWAIVWGVEAQWLEHLQVLSHEQQPAWYDGSGFDASRLASFRAATVSGIGPIVSSSGGWSSSSSSSFSSGSSGGGFSGGGGGGGGGGGR